MSVDEQATEDWKSGRHHQATERPFAESDQDEKKQ